MSSQIPVVNIADKPSNQTTTIDLYASREKIYVRSTSGYFQNIRKVSLSLLLLMYFLFAWINIDGQPLIHFDLSEQKFHLFGATFWPQDFTLLAFALIISAFGLFFITSLFGRVWCGYSCPQSVWSFMFIWLEELIEGSRNQRIKLDQAPNSVRKTLKKGLKHLSWSILAFATATTFVGYFYPIRELTIDMLNLSVSSGWAIFWITFFTLATYINAGWLREQVCIYMCPYARFQSVMFNENTLIVGYDELRGEPRHKSVGSAEQNKGDCVDCKVCVQVCPVGIDIREGLQYECIGCALCIDACDSIMKKLDKPAGLIRYASEKELAHGDITKTFDIRSIGYALALATSIIVFLSLLNTRPMTELMVIRDRGSLYQENGLGQIENFYTLRVINKSNWQRAYTLSLDSKHYQLSHDTIKVEPGEIKTIPISISIDPEKIQQSNKTLTFGLTPHTQSDTTVKTESKFLGPVS